MRLRLSFLIANFLLISSASAVEGGSDRNYDAVVIEDAQLFYETEMKRNSHGVVSGAGGWLDRDFVKNTDKVVSGDGVVFGLSRVECWSFPGDSYMPSECGDGESVVIAMNNIPAVGSEVGIDDLEYVAASFFLGSRYGAGRSGCLGFPTKFNVGILEISDISVKLSIRINFEMKIHSRYPASCGERSVDGEYLFQRTSMRNFVNIKHSGNTAGD